jgi:hypothetical protein
VASEEKSAWIMAVLAIAGYVVYLVITLGRAAGRAITETPYVDVMLWTIGGSIVASMVLHAFARVYTGRGPRTDERDRQFAKRSESAGQAFVVIGALGALVLAWVQADWFWIANLLYLCFVLSALLSSIMRIVAYRSGLPSW